MRFSNYMRVIPSPTVAINALAERRRAEGRAVYNVSIGEPLVLTPPEVLLAAEEAMRAGKTRYAAPEGVYELRRAGSEWMNAWYGTRFSVSETVVTCGGKFGLFSVFQALLNPGDEVVMAAPYWVSYPSMVELFGGKPVIVSAQEKDGWKITPEAIAKALTSRTKIFSFNNAANPTGVVYTREEVRALLRVAAEHDVVVVSDEVYSGLTYDGAEFVSAGSFSEYADRVVVIQSCSKNFAMTGWRVGFVFAPRELAAVVAMLQSQSTTGTGTVNQWAAIAAIAAADRIMPEINVRMRERRDACLVALRNYFPNSIFTAPASGLYIFVSLASLGLQEKDDVRWAERTLAECGVALVPGTAFGAPGYVRFSFGGDAASVADGIRILAEHIRG